MSKTAQDLLNVMQSWVGKSEANGGHKEIIDLYNSVKPLPRNYKVKYTDEWCDTTVSAAGIKAGMSDLIGRECSCQRHIDIFKEKGIWIEDGKITPEAGYIIVYNWDDGTQPNDGWADHIGVVEKVANGKITIIEGNYNCKVARRVISVGWGYIRGYAAPKYEKKATASTSSGSASTGSPNSVKAKKAAQSYLKSLAGTYKVTASWLYVRHGAGKANAAMVTIPKGTEVKCYGYYTTAAGTKWLYVQFYYNGVVYTGFASSKYLKK